MSDLPGSAQTMKPQDGVQQSMCLQLQNNSDFLTSSSSSSSSTSSPDSTYSLSSLGVESPERMAERKETTSEDDSGIQSPECRPDDNDNSVSIYLDANEEGWHADRDEQDNVTIVQNRESDDVFRDAEQGRRGSGDSSATEEQLFSSEYDEGEDERDSFLSLRPADVVMKKQSGHEEVQMCSLNKRPRVELQQEAFRGSVDHPDEEDQMCSLPIRPCVDPVSEHHQEAFQDLVDHRSEEGQMCSSSVRPGVGPLIELSQEVFQDSVERPNGEGQTSDSAMRPSVEAVENSVVHPNKDGQTLESAVRPIVVPMGELHEEVPQVFYTDKGNMQKSAKTIDVDVESELQHKAYQDSAELHRKQEQCSNRNLDASQKFLQDSMELHKNENQLQTKRPNVNLGRGVHQEAVQASEKSPHHPPAELNLNQTMSPSLFQGAPPSTPIQNIQDPSCFPNNSPDLSRTRSRTRHPKIRFTNVELKRCSRPNLKDVKPKIISRAMSAPRPATTNHSQSAAGCGKIPLPTRSRAANRRERGDDGVDRNRASSTQARAAMSTATSDSDTKSTSPPKFKRQPPEIPESDVTSNGCQVQTARSKVAESVRDERGDHKEDELVQAISKDGDVDQTVSTDLRPPAVITRVPSRGCVSAGVRAAPLTGVPKMRVIDSSTAACGPAPSWKAPPKSASSKLPIKNGGLPPSLSSSSVGSTASENKGAAQVMKSEETCIRPSISSQGKAISIKPAAGVRNRPNTLAKPNTAGQKVTAHVIQSKNSQNGLQRGGPVRTGRSPGTVCPSSRGSRGTRPSHTHTEEEDEKKNRSILQLRSLVAHGNRRLEALAVVVQHIFNEREDALKQKKEISIQLKNLQEELAQSVVCCERLECEKASVCARLEATVSTLQQQHQAELAQLEDRLRDFYSSEWDKAHQAYQDEADRCTVLMRQQVEEVKSKQEALRAEQEVAHGQQMKELRQGYENRFTELQQRHERDRQELDHTLKSSEAALNEKIVRLTEENEALSERLREAEEKRKALADKSQRDSRVVYLEQELESLRVVLDIKTNQLHQQDKKLMQIDKLIESNSKLEEFVTKLQQENEDYKARMDRHAEMSRQLSTEQVMLQQTLQKESKANKRLSMENEELLWKLHNGFSPRNSASFPSSPDSPR